MLAVHEARKRGVLFDVGHGQGSFSWTVAEICAQEGIYPDTLSTDLHSGNIKGPAYDLPSVLTKMLVLGMPLKEVIRASTASAAKAIGWSDRIGSLSLGREVVIATFAGLASTLILTLTTYSRPISPYLSSKTSMSCLKMGSLNYAIVNRG